MNEIDQAQIDKHSQIRGLWTAAIIGLVNLTFFIFALTLPREVWHDWFLTILPGFLFFISIISLSLIQRGRLSLGVGIVFVGNLLLASSAATFQIGLAPISIGYIILSSSIILFWVLPAASRKWTMIAVVISIAWIVLIEIWNPSGRVSTPELISFAPIVTAVMSLAFIGVAIHQLWTAGRIPLNLRLTLLMLVIIVPVIFGTVYLLVNRSRTYITDQRVEQLISTHNVVSSKVDIWLDFNVRSLDQMVNLPSIRSMDSEIQHPILTEMTNIYPHMYLVSTTDLSGVNIARSDDANMKDYSDRTWFTGARNDSPLTLQTLVGKTSGEPALVASIPIKDASGSVIGVGMFASDLTTIAQEVEVNTIGEAGYAYVIDSDNKVIAHPDPSYSSELRDLSEYPPVEMLRQGETGLITFTDEDDVSWQAYVSELEIGWGVIVQEPETESELIVSGFQRLAWIGLAGAVIVFTVFVWFFIRASVSPIEELTVAADAFAKGDLSRQVSIQREDEFGALSLTFNTMATQLRDLIGSLEQQVEDRTRALETSTEVSRRLSTILDQDQLVREVVEQLRSAFGYYHAQIYLYDDSRQNLEMAGGTGEAGRTMLAKGHKIEKGRGLVGRAAETNQIVLISDVSQAEGWLPNPLLPDTKAEVAVPIAIGLDVLGVMDVQHNITNGLEEQDAVLIQTIANQVGIAVQNAQAYTQAQKNAERENLIVVISQRIQAAPTIDDVLKIAVSELGEALGARTSNIDLKIRTAHQDE